MLVLIGSNLEAIYKLALSCVFAYVLDVCTQAVVDQLFVCLLWCNLYSFLAVHVSLSSLCKKKRAMR